MADGGINERELILDILLECEKGEYLNLILRNVLDKYAYLPEYSRSFIKLVCEGTTERMLSLDLIIDSCSSTKTKKMKPLIRALLRMSVYQLKFMDQIPSSAAINEAVKLCKKRHFATLSGFVNGVLRAVDRMSEEKLEALFADDMSAKYSCPEWIAKLIVSNYGDENAERILTSSLKGSPLVIRANRRKNSPDELIKILEAEGVKAHHHSFAPDGLVLEGVSGLSELESFAEGRFTVQDASSQLVGVLSGVSSDMKVLDLCAAPGGKSIHISELMDGTGSVVANDVSEYKLSMIEDNVRRLKADNVTVSLSDATQYREEFAEAFDLVIADLPCSGLGVFGRKSDLKYRLNPEDLGALKQLQRQILENAARYVKKGGTLLYSTCTINPGENVRQLGYINKELLLSSVSIEDLLPAALKGRDGEKGYIQLLQGVDDCDGFFISKFVK